MSGRDVRGPRDRWTPPPLGFMLPEDAHIVDAAVASVAVKKPTLAPFAREGVLHR